VPTFLIPELQVLLWSIVVFFTLLWLLWKFAWGPIMHALEERERRIQKTIDDADVRFKEGEAKAAEYARRLEAARHETATAIDQGRRSVESMKVAILAETKREADQMLAHARHEIELATEAAAAELREKTVQLTAELAARVLAREVKPADHQRFIEEAVQEMAAQKE
jgi:F-type H+-transporting ATPase subunit b